jgi:hypothetical protein
MTYVLEMSKLQTPHFSEVPEVGGWREPASTVCQALNERNR